MSETAKALDTLFAAFITQNTEAISAGVAALIVGVIGLLTTMVAVRRAKIKTAADGAVDTVEAKTSHRVQMDALQKKWDAQGILAEATGLPPVKLAKEIQAAFDRRKALQKTNTPSVRPPV